LEQAVKMITELRESIAAVQEAEGHHDGNHEAHAMFIHEELVPAMERARAASDALEAVVPMICGRFPELQRDASSYVDLGR
jgi:glutamine synthetase type III